MNLEAQRFFDMLSAAKALLWEGCFKYTKLSASLKALSIKSDYIMQEGCFNRIGSSLGCLAGVKLHCQVKHKSSFV